MQIENNNYLLDVFMIRLSIGRLDHSGYCKPTHTGKYLHTNSHHHHFETFTMNSIMFRKLSSARAIKYKIINPNSNKEEHIFVVFLPYVHQITNCISTVVRKQKVKSFHSFGEATNNCRQNVEIFFDNSHHDTVHFEKT